MYSSRVADILRGRAAVHSVSPLRTLILTTRGVAGNRERLILLYCSHYSQLFFKVK